MEKNGGIDVWRASDPDLPPYLLEKCASSEKSATRQDVAGNTRLPERLQEKLLGDPIRTVRKEVLTNPSLTERLQFAIVKGVSFVAWNPGALLRKDLPLIESTWSKAMLAGNLGVTTRAQAALLAEDSVSTHVRLAGNPSVDATILERLTWEQRSEVLDILAQNPSLVLSRRMPVAFLRAHARAWLADETRGLDYEAYWPLEASWEGSLADLMEAIELTHR